MTLHARRLPLALDPLIAEAKRRMRRRRFVVGLMVVVVGGVFAVTLALRPSTSHSLTLSPTPRTGIARIPGMTLVSSDHSKVICNGGTGLRPQYCDQDVVRALNQTWALTAAVKRYGVHRAAAVLPVAFARRHPGPATVTVEVRTLGAWQGRDLAGKLLHSDYTACGCTDYSALQSWAIDGGVAGRVDGIALTEVGQSEIRFAWVAGTSVVMVNVVGADLTVAEAQQVAALAGPAS